MTLLQTRGLTARYGDFQALFGVDITLAAGECVAIIGASSYDSVVNAQRAADAGACTPPANRRCTSVSSRAVRPAGNFGMLRSALKKAKNQN